MCLIKWILQVVLSTGLLLAFFTDCDVFRAALVGAQPPIAQDIPDGYDFPADAATLLKLRDNENSAGMRTHAWLVFAALAQPAKMGKPVWTTWHYRDVVFGDQKPDGGRRKFNEPTQLNLGHVLETRESLPNIDMNHALPTVNMYNEAAYRHIRDNKYHLKASLQTLIMPDARADIKPFPRTAVVLKTIWWPIKKDELTPLPVWDQDALNTAEQGNGYTTFKRIVAVDPTRTQIPDAETTNKVRFHNPKKPEEIISRPETRVVSLERFFHFALTASDAQDVNQTIKDYFKGWLGREIREGDHAVLLGFHMTTREIPDWVWATFWWHDRPTAGPLAADRPNQVTGVWRNYVMAVSYSMDTPKESDGTAHVAFNPYLEGPFSNGILANCMACHRRAVWPTKQLANDNPLVNPFVVTRGKLPSDAPMFTNRTTTDFLWSIPLHSK